MEEENVFLGKTEEEAIQEGLMTLAISRSEAEIEVIEEGKKRLFGSTRWKVRVTKKSVFDGTRAAQFVEGLLAILKTDGKCEVVAEDESIKIEIKSENSSKVIGKHGDVLDAIQCLAGAVANIGRDSYKKVVVDCENYRSQREETLRNLADRLAKKAVALGRKIALEPMNPYERRIIHSALVGKNVRTVSEGKEPARYIVIVPDNADPNDKGIRDDRRRGGRDGKRYDRRGDRRERGGRDERRGPRPSGGAKRGKKEIHFGAFLGNSGAGKAENTAPATPDKEQK